MEQMARLKARIESLNDLQNIIHAIRGIAATRVQEAQKALSGVRNYVDIVENAIGEAASLTKHISDLPVQDQFTIRSALIVIGSEQGFVGSYNETLLEEARATLGKTQKLGIVGQRAVATAQESGMTIDWHFPMAAYVPNVATVARRISQQISAVDHAVILYAHYEQAGRYTIQKRTVLPLDPALLVGVERQSHPLHNLSPIQLLQSLATEYLFAELTRAITEALASENGARLSIMQGADKNIGDKLDGLTREERIVRQEAVTVELLDILTGAEAVSGNAK